MVEDRSNLKDGRWLSLKRKGGRTVIFLVFTKIRRRPTFIIDTHHTMRIEDRLQLHRLSYPIYVTHTLGIFTRLYENKYLTF